MYQIWSLNHDGWERERYLSYDAFDEAFMQALEMAAKGTDWAYNQQIRIKYNDVMLLDIHREGAKKLWAAIHSS